MCVFINYHIVRFLENRRQCPMPRYAIGHLKRRIDIARDAVPQAFKLLRESDSTGILQRIAALDDVEQA